MRIRSRRDKAAIDGGLSTAPGERRVLPVVPAAHVVPGQTQRMDMAPRRMREGEDVRRRMTGVRKGDRLGSRGIDPHRRLGGHVYGIARLDGPLRAVAFEADWRGLHPKHLTDQAAESG